MNFPTSHPLHLGFDSTPYLKEADVVLVIDTDVPWLPTVVTPKETTRASFSWGMSLSTIAIQFGDMPQTSRWLRSPRQHSAC